MNGFCFYSIGEDIYRYWRMYDSSLPCLVSSFRLILVVSMAWSRLKSSTSEQFTHVCVNGLVLSWKAYFVVLDLDLKVIALRRCISSLRTVLLTNCIMLMPLMFVTLLSRLFAAEFSSSLNRKYVVSRLLDVIYPSWVRSAWD